MPGSGRITEAVTSTESYLVTCINRKVYSIKIVVTHSLNETVTYGTVSCVI